MCVVAGCEMSISGGYDVILRGLVGHSRQEIVIPEVTGCYSGGLGLIP